jgi:hypothetical protein
MVIVEEVMYFNWGNRNLMRFDVIEIVDFSLINQIQLARL